MSLGVSLVRQLTASGFIRVITAIILVIALERCVNASSTVGTSELVQSTSDAGAALLVLSTSTVKVSITFLFGWHARVSDLAVCVDARCVARHAAVDVVGLAFAER